MLFLTVNLILQLIVGMCEESRNLNVKSVQFLSVILQQTGIHVRKTVLPSGKLLEETGDLTNIWLDLAVQP